MRDSREEKMQSTDRLMPHRIEKAIRESQFWHQLIYMDQVGSTNDVAKDLASQGAPEGTIVIAEEQTAGRGRMDRRWIAPPGSSILCSILFRPDLSPDQANRLTMLCSMAAADAVEQVAELPVAIKWPNDLIVASGDTQHPSETWGKLAGILTETGMTGAGLDFAVVGIGINVNVPPEELPDLAPDATSLLAETGRETDRSALLVALLESVELRYEQLRSGQSPREEWSARLATLGQRIHVTTTQVTLEGVAEAVDEDGALLLRTADGTVHRLVTGDVTLSQT
jgi:BirA family biotin operon repressor/biotin-[acetyl-CoA-carboxylase] ligase